jgi:hypothetical protein
MDGFIKLADNPGDNVMKKESGQVFNKIVVYLIH